MLSEAWRELEFFRSADHWKTSCGRRGLQAFLEPATEEVDRRVLDGSTVQSHFVGTQKTGDGLGPERDRIQGEPGHPLRQIERIQQAGSFETSDRYLASYLVAACGAGLWLCEAHSRDRISFGLTPRPDPAVLAACHNGQATVSVRSFCRVLCSLEREMQYRE